MERWRPKGTARKSCGGKAPRKQLQVRRSSPEKSDKEPEEEIIPNSSVVLMDTLVSVHKNKLIHEQAISEDVKKIFGQMVTLCIEGSLEKLKKIKCGSGYFMHTLDEKNEGQLVRTTDYLLIHNAHDSNTGYRLIDFAVLHGHKNVVEYLLKKGAEIEARVPWKDTHNALDVAIKAGHEEIVKFLLSYGAKVEHKLYLAISEGQIDIAMMLLKGDGFNKVDIDALSENGFNALHFATKQNNIDVMKLLLTNGADPNQKSGREGRGRSA